MTESRIDDPYWPLILGEFPLEHLRWALPLTFSQLAPALKTELLSLDGLQRLLEIPGVIAGPPANLLIKFVRTRAAFDRKLDIEHEVSRLASEEHDKGVPLWKLLAYLIVSRDIDDRSKVYALEDLYQKFDMPEELKPFTLYGFTQSEPPGAEALVRGLKKTLQDDLRLPH